MSITCSRFCLFVPLFIAQIMPCYNKITTWSAPFDYQTWEPNLELNHISHLSLYCIASFPFIFVSRKNMSSIEWGPLFNLNQTFFRFFLLRTYLPHQIRKLLWLAYLTAACLPTRAKLDNNKILLIFLTTSPNLLQILKGKVSLSTAISCSMDYNLELP